MALQTHDEGLNGNSNETFGNDEADAAYGQHQRIDLHDRNKDLDLNF